MNGKVRVIVGYVCSSRPHGGDMVYFGFLCAVQCSAFWLLSDSIRFRPYFNLRPTFTSKTNKRTRIFMCVYIKSWKGISNRRKVAQQGAG